MSTLPSELRGKLERVVIEAREAAEAGARAALEALAIHHYEPYPHMKPAQRQLRNQLRARARQLGDRQDTSGRLTVDHLVGECAYEHWHRMLFARFLAENGLLIEPQEKMAISLAEAEELAKEEGVDIWVFASRCAQDMLPQIFRPEDPLLQVSFATEHRIKLERLLDSLPQAVFTASDSLGWVYQYWQSKKKDEVNQSEVKIGADEISAVTQLFTEPYMVNFLLHNTLGAWWAGKKLSVEEEDGARDEDELRRKVSFPGVAWEYLRFIQGANGKGGPWRPAAGTFGSWPKNASEIKVLDPCCGSGHFLVAALQHLVPIRMAEEGLSARKAVDAVLSDNLHGLEIDERCCQIAAFALAFAAWTYPDAGGHRQLPDFHIACCGIGPQSNKDQWLRLAEEAAARGGMPAKRNLFGTEETLLSGPVKATLELLYELFAQAPVLGALVNPAGLPSDLFHADYQTVAPLLSKILKAESIEDETRERAIAAAGMVKAGDLLAGRYTLVITNVPYLGRGKQDDILKTWIEEYYRDGKADLATAFLLRSLDFCAEGGSLAFVTPQNWLFLTTYTKLRELLLKRREWNLVVRLGQNAFQGMNWWAATTALFIVTARVQNDRHFMSGIDVSKSKAQAVKAAMLQGKVSAPIFVKMQAKQQNSPDARIVLEDGADTDLLGRYCESYQGIASADLPQYGRVFWELDALLPRWSLQQGTVKKTEAYGGREAVLLWDNGIGELTRNQQARIQGLAALGKRGVAISQMRLLPSTLFDGDLFDNNVAAVIPKNQNLLLAVWAYCSSQDFVSAVRAIDQKSSVTNATFTKVPFDMEFWQKVASKRFPNGLPDPESDDPRQWLFHGWPQESTVPLQVAVARLLGYCWPAEIDPKIRISKRSRALVNRCNELVKFTDSDGIVCIPSVRGEGPAGEQVEKLLKATDVKPTKAQLAGMADLDDWLRNGYFQEHCKLFHDRPFVWHIWDGRKGDGFHALVNYHKLCEGDGKGRKLLESLTYSYLGEWIIRQRDGVKRGEGGAEDRLAAALELQKRLEAILEGEPPFDIFVRWKPLSKQPIGWEPDINDGVRLNIRPFLASDLANGRAGAGILRYKPNIKWGKDRGKEPERPREEYPWFWGWDEKSRDFMGGKNPDGNRWNGCHYTNKAKQAAREAAEKGKP